MELYKTAIKDADAALEVDPSCTKAWERRGTRHGLERVFGYVCVCVCVCEREREKRERERERSKERERERERSKERKRERETERVSE